MSGVVARIRVFLTAAPTYLVAFATILTIVADELGDLAGGDVTAWFARVVAWLGAAVTIIRRVTPVLPDERGVLPPAGSA